RRDARPLRGGLRVGRGGVSGRDGVAPASASADGPLRIVFVCANRRWTGGERAMTTAANGLAARGHDVAFAYDPRGAVGERLGPGVRAAPVPVRNDADPIAILQLRRLIRGH